MTPGTESSLHRCSVRAAWLVLLLVGLTISAPALAQESGTAGSVTATRPMTFGAFPHHSLMQLEAFYAPLAQKLGGEIGRPVRFGTSSTHQRFQKRLEKRDFDLALVTAGDYVQRARAAGYEPLIRLDGSNLIVFAAGPTSKLARIEDVRGMRVAVAPEDGTFLRLALALLKKHGLDPTRDLTLLEVPDHNACLEHLASGRTDVCATTAGALTFSGASEGEDYKVIGRGEMEFPPLLVVSSSVSATDRQTITTILSKWIEDSVLRGQLRVVPATDADYARLLAHGSTVDASGEGIANAMAAGDH